MNKKVFFTEFSVSIGYLFIVLIIFLCQNIADMADTDFLCIVRKMIYPVYIPVYSPETGYLLAVIKAYSASEKIAYNCDAGGKK